MNETQRRIGRKDFLKYGALTLATAALAGEDLHARAAGLSPESAVCPEPINVPKANILAVMGEFILVNWGGDNDFGRVLPHWKTKINISGSESDLDALKDVLNRVGISEIQQHADGSSEKEMVTLEELRANPQKYAVPDVTLGFRGEYEVPYFRGSCWDFKAIFPDELTVQLE